MNRLRRFPALVLAAWLAGTTSATWPQALPSADEDSIKLSYLTKLPKFVDWPTEALPSSTREFTFCVLGDDEFNAIRSTFQGQSIGGKPVAVIDAKRQGSMQACHVLYLAPSEGWRVRDILGQLRSAPTLTISGISGFCAQGGIIGLVREDDRLKFEINAKVAKQSGLAITAQLLSLAVKVW